MNKKKLNGIVYSTNPDYIFENEGSRKVPTLSPQLQKLYIWLESKGRNGKVVTVIKGFEGTPEDLEKLSGELKKSCGTGGSVKDGEILIQGNFREKILLNLSQKGYQVKKAGGN
jgi:translation initiation factor 1